jgi:hypothetical protein
MTVFREYLRIFWPALVFRLGLLGLVLMCLWFFFG